MIRFIHMFKLQDGQLANKGVVFETRREAVEWMVDYLDDLWYGDRVYHCTLEVQEMGDDLKTKRLDLLGEARAWRQEDLDSAQLDHRHNLSLLVPR